MLETLSAHLRTAASPELQAAIEEACDHFEHYNVSSWQDHYNELLFTLDNEDAGDNVVALTQLTQNLQQAVLQQFQIQLQDNTTVSRTNRIFDGLEQIETTELTQEILTICGEGGDPVELFCAMLELLTSEHATVYHECIHDVGQSLIDRIRDSTRQRQPAELDSEPFDVQADRAAVTALKDFVQAMKLDKVLVYDLIRDHVRLHQPFLVYYDQLIGRIDPAKPKQAAIEFFAAHLISCETDDQLRSNVAKALELTYADLNIITAITMELEAVILANHARQTSGIKEVL